MLNKLRERNIELIERYKDDQNKLHVQLLIKDILEDDNCFMKMDINIAYGILKDLNVNEDRIDQVYVSVMSFKNKK